MLEIFEEYCAKKILEKIQVAIYNFTFLYNSKIHLLLYKNKTNAQKNCFAIFRTTNLYVSKKLNNLK